MPTPTAELTKEEILQRGKEIYHRNIQPRVEPDNKGRVVAIDVHSGEFELADDAVTSASQLRARLPDASVFFVRIGRPTTISLR